MLVLYTFYLISIPVRYRILPLVTTQHRGRWTSLDVTKYQEHTLCCIYKRNKSKYIKLIYNTLLLSNYIINIYLYYKSENNI